MDDKTRNTARSQRTQSVAHRFLLGATFVIPYPHLEEVAEDVECLGGRGVRAQEGEKLLDSRRGSGVQMNIGDEQPTHFGD